MDAWINVVPKNANNHFNTRTTIEEHNTGMQRREENTLVCTGGMYSSTAGFIQGGDT